MNLHIVSFDIPYPPNYGGVIDVYYKIKALHEAGIAVHLHCFEYHRKQARELSEICSTVQYYPRITGWRASLAITPYIVLSRKSETLVQRLSQDNYPILFEGLHTCYYLNHPGLRNRFKIYRESNIEHHYYYHLFRAETSPWKKLFYLAESIRLSVFQPKISAADLMLTVSTDDQRYLQQHFPGKRILNLPSFHRHDEIQIAPGKGSYILYHGNLSVGENLQAIRFIIREIYDASLPELIVAGLNPPGSLMKEVSMHDNIRLIPNPDEDQLASLVRNAHINLLVTAQPTGLKLKLLNALFTGRFCLVNPSMLAGTGLESVCHQAVNPHEFKEQIHRLLKREFTQEMILEREQILMNQYSNKKNCKILMDILTLL